jgi:hypothetical protein
MEITKINIFTLDDLIKIKLALELMPNNTFIHESVLEECKIIINKVNKIIESIKCKQI